MSNAGKRYLFNQHLQVGIRGTGFRGLSEYYGPSVIGNCPLLGALRNAGQLRRHYSIVVSRVSLFKMMLRPVGTFFRQLSLMKLIGC
jgi:hypothetical protein